MFLIYSKGGVPHIINGQYVLQNHGEVIREITKTEYNAFQANEVRGFSGHWMVFYSFAACVLYPKNLNN